MACSYSKLAVAGAVSLMVSACGQYGPEVHAFPPAVQPAGITSHIYVFDAFLQAELLAVEDSALLVLVDQLSEHRLAGRFARIPFSRIRTARFMHAGLVRYSFSRFLLPGRNHRPMPEPYVSSGGNIGRNVGVREHLRRFSRFPQGVNEDLLSRLSTVYGEVAYLRQEGDQWMSAEQHEFLLGGRRASEPYHNTEAAFADGFRPLGADAPAMGRHWVNFSRLFDGEIDPSRPEILTYVVVDGHETLAGIGFGYIAGRGDHMAQVESPFGPDAWHVHSGGLDAESHRMDHVGDGLPGHGTVAGRRVTDHGVSVVHAWVWVENPAGVLEPNNWALPYFRLGLSRPGDATPEADRAISLASLGAGFFIDRAALFADPGSDETTAGIGALRAAETEVTEWWQARSPGPLTSAEVEWLGRLWRRYRLTGL